MSERMKKSASGNGRYSDLRQVIESTDTKRADAWLRDDELKGYGTSQFSGVRTDPGYRVFISPYLFVWRTEQARDVTKKDTTPKIETEFVSVKGMNYGRNSQYDLMVEVRYENQTFMIGGLNLVYKQIRSASVTEYRFSGLNADWTKLSPAPPAYLEEDKKKWEDRNTPLFYVRINLLDIWFSLPGFKAE